MRGVTVGIDVIPAVVPIVVFEVIAFVILNFVLRGHHRISDLVCTLPDAEDVTTDLLGESRSPP